MGKYNRTDLMIQSIQEDILLKKRRVVAGTPLRLPVSCACFAAPLPVYCRLAAALLPVYRFYVTIKVPAGRFGLHSHCNLAALLYDPIGLNDYSISGTVSLCAALQLD